MKRNVKFLDMPRKTISVFRSSDNDERVYFKDDNGTEYFYEKPLSAEGESLVRFNNAINSGILSMDISARLYKTGKNQYQLLAPRIAS